MQVRIRAAILDCGGRAMRRDRFRSHRARSILFPAPSSKSGVALRFPPQSKNRPGGFIATLTLARV
jgi:hypothetical protein